MAGLIKYQGSFEQVLSDHPVGESMGKTLDMARPTPDHKVGETALLQVFDRRDPEDILAAHVAPLVDAEGVSTLPESSTPTNIAGVYIGYV